MNTRFYFLMTAISGMVGMLGLIVLNLCKHWIENNPAEKLSDDGIDQLHQIVITSSAAFYVSLIALAVFLVSMILFLATRAGNSPGQ
jgi:hypothetical protein